VKKTTIDGPWIERLAHHLKAEEYNLSSIKTRMTAARQFPRYLGNKFSDVTMVTTFAKGLRPSPLA
jgi:hypothetical protein